AALRAGSDGITHGSASGDRQRAALAGNVLPPAHGMYWGAFVAHAPARKGTLARFIGKVGRTPAILMWYQSWFGRPDFPTKRARMLRRKGIVPMLTWEPWRPRNARHPWLSEKAYRLQYIANGRFDRYIRRYARQ